MKYLSPTCLQKFERARDGRNESLILNLIVKVSPRVQRSSAEFLKPFRKKKATATISDEVGERGGGEGEICVKAECGGLRREEKSLMRTHTDGKGQATVCCSSVTGQREGMLLECVCDFEGNDYL